MNIERKLQEINLEIEQIEARLAVSHGLGDNNAAKGISAGFSDNRYWRKQLSKLREQREQYESLSEGKRPSIPNILLTNINRTY